MSVELEILITVLKLTQTGPIEYSLVSRSARIPACTAEGFLERLAATGLVKWKGKTLEASPEQRVGIAVQALKLGADFERVCRLVEWKEFESIAKVAFEAFSYQVVRNFRFKGRNGKRWEIDLLSYKQPIIVSLDCKLWRRNWARASIIKTSEEHVERTRAFVDCLPILQAKFNLDGWTHATVIPLVLSLLPGPFKFHRATPIVPILQLRSFLNELPFYTELLSHFRQEIATTDRRLTDY